MGINCSQQTLPTAPRKHGFARRQAEDGCYPNSCPSIHSACTPGRGRDVELTAEAMEAIGDYYAELRSESATGALPVTVRMQAPSGLVPDVRP